MEEEAESQAQLQYGDVYCVSGERVERANDFGCRIKELKLLVSIYKYGDLDRRTIPTFPRTKVYSQVWNMIVEPNKSFSITSQWQ